ncbi:MAG: sodium:proton antiporter [Pyrinomonadaceae bacterium]
MEYLGWMALVSAVLLTIALTSAYVRHMPITTAALYLTLGVAIGPVGFGLVSVDFFGGSVFFEHLTEVAVIVSLFVGGLKLRLPFKHPAWQAAFRLAGPVMVLTISGIAAFSHFVFGLPWAPAFLLGAVLAPTDPVLASTVAVEGASDQDRMRYGLSGEAGFNDGAAFPFIVFALMWMQMGQPGEWTAGWALRYMLWAVPAGLAIGFFLGKGLGHVSIWLRSRHAETQAPNDLLALALIGLAYVGAESVGAWGFLAAFGAGLGFRKAEIDIIRENPHPEANRDPETIADDGIAHPPAEEIVTGQVDEEDMRHPAMASGVVISEIISFGHTAERLMEVLMVVLVGVAVGIYWDWRAIPLALALFFVLRPLAVYLCLVRTPTGRYQRSMMAWFGIRGIGSLYYLAYSLSHGLRDHAADIVGLTFSVVALSIVMHGISCQPLLNIYERRLERLRN